MIIKHPSEIIWCEIWSADTKGQIDGWLITLKKFISCLNRTLESHHVQYYNSLVTWKKREQMRFRPSPSISFAALGVWFCCQYTMNRFTCKFVYVNVLSSQPNIGLLFSSHAHLLVTWYYWNQTIQLQKVNLKLILLIKESFNETNYKSFFFFFSLFPYIPKQT